MNLRKLAYKYLEDKKSKKFIIANEFFGFLTVVSIVSLTLETVQSFSSLMPLFTAIEWITVIFFSLEYIGRIIATNKPQKYIFSFFGVIDLLAILPTFFGVGNLTFLKSVRILRLLRFLRILRILKLARGLGGKSEKDLHDDLVHLTVGIYFTALISSIVIFASLIFIAEGYRPEFTNIPMAMFWSAKVLFGGVIQAAPETLWGEVVTITARFVGLILFGLLINVVGGVVKKMLFGEEKITK